MPVSPYPVTITLKDTDNSTAVNGGKCYIRNITKKTESDEETTNASGVALIDLANLPLASGQTSPYDLGDQILMIGYYKNSHDAALYTVAGTNKSQTLNLNPVPYTGGNSGSRTVSVHLLSLILGNTTGTVAYAKVYDLQNGQLITHVECPANDSRFVDFGDFGRKCPKGFVVEREANTLIVTANWR